MRTAALVLLMAFAAVGRGDNVAEPTKKNTPRIVREAITNQPIHDSRLDGKLILTSADGSKKTLGIVIFTRPSKDAATTETVIRILSPSDDPGATLLILQKEGEHARIYYHETQAQTAQEITVDKSRDRFLDTDFSYEDINFSFLRWGQQEFVREEKRLSRKCDVIKSIPTAEEKSQYAYVLSWLDQEERAPLVTEGYDSQGTLLKKMVVKGFERSGGGLVIKEMAIEDVKRDHKTTLKTTRADFHVNHPDALFTKESFFRDISADNR